MLHPGYDVETWNWHGIQCAHSFQFCCILTFNLRPFGTLQWTRKTNRYLYMNQLSLRKKQLKFRSLGNLAIIAEKSINLSWVNMLKIFPGQWVFKQSVMNVHPSIFFLSLLLYCDKLRFIDFGQRSWIVSILLIS